MIGGNTKFNRSSRKNKFFFLLLVVILVLFVYNYVKNWGQNNEVNQEITSLENNIQNLEQDNAKLEELIEYFNSTAYIEERARRDLGLKKDGEKVVIITNQNDRKLPTISQPEEIKDQTNISNPKKWWDYFFN